MVVVWLRPSALIVDGVSGRVKVESHERRQVRPEKQSSPGVVSSVALVTMGSWHLALAGTDAIRIWIGQPHKKTWDPSCHLKTILQDCCRLPYPSDKLIYCEAFNHKNVVNGDMYYFNLPQFGKQECPAYLGLMYA